MSTFSYLTGDDFDKVSIYQTNRIKYEPSTLLETNGQQYTTILFIHCINKGTSRKITYSKVLNKHVAKSCG